MGYSPSPRPNFSGPAHIPYKSVTRHLWGDETAGEVADWIYVSSDGIHQLLFGLAPGGSFRHSDAFRTIFAADEILYVLSGVMVLANPDTGEVHRIEAGEAGFFRRDTWHHVFNYSDEPLRVLEYFAPPPSQGTSGSYAQTKPNLAESRYTPAEWMGQWPMARSKAADSFTIQTVGPRDVLWRLEGEQHRTLVGLLAATEHLTVGRMEILPGARTDRRVHDGDQGIYLRAGKLHVSVPENDGQQWFELDPGDGFYLPDGTPHSFYNMTDQRAELLFGAA